MKMKLMKNKKYLEQKKFSRKVLVPQTTADFTSRVSKSYVPFTCKFPMVMHFVPILHRRCRSKTNFYVFGYDKTSLKFCANFRSFLAVFMEKFNKIRYLNYVRRGIKCLFSSRSNNWWYIIFPVCPSAVNSNLHHNFIIMTDRWVMCLAYLTNCIYMYVLSS